MVMIAFHVKRITKTKNLVMLKGIANIMLPYDNKAEIPIPAALVCEHSGSGRVDWSVISIHYEQ